MSDVPQKLPPKKEVALALLEGPSMFVHLDPRRQGVLVPKRFLDKPQLVLQVGMNMVIPIPDLTVDDEGVSCTLSFDRAPFWCRMPWNAIYALVGEDGRGMMWPTDIPPEVVAQMQSPPPKDKDGGKPQPQKRQKTKLAAVGQSERERERKSPEKTEEKPTAQLESASLAPAEPETAAASDAADVTRSDEPKADVSQERPRPQPIQTAGRKPKRELPPYLRVIK